MDNITHSVIGFGVGELVHRSLAPEPDPARQRVRHRLLLVACALASNFPDLDLLLTPLLPNPLGYLLSHRGHTHTLLLALPQAALLAALLWFLWPSARALLRTSAAARGGLAASVLLGLGLHLLMDFTNSYGIHPFYPFDGRWFYGDMVFIVEPLFWVAIGVPMALIMRWPMARLLGLGALALALAACAAKGFLGWPSLAALLLAGLACGAAQLRAGARGRAGLLLALALSAGWIGVQGAASRLGRQQIGASLHALDPKARLLDVAMTAFPSQPLCWNFVSVESDEAAGTYRLRRGVGSVAPRWLAVDACPAAMSGLPGAGPAVATLAPGLVQLASVTASLRDLRARWRDDCRVDAWLRFSRAPALSMTAGRLDDYRFAATPRGNFTTLPLDAPGPAACPQRVPGWAYPRADLLSPRAGAALAN